MPTKHQRLALLLAVCALAGTGVTHAQLNYEPFAFTTVAGHPVFLGSADGTGGAAQFRNPSGTAVDSGGKLYVADTLNHTIRKITSGGVVTTLAGLAGTVGSTDGAGSAARFNTPYGVAVDTSGTVYVADSFGYTIRKITPAGGVSTLAGLADAPGSADGAGSTARFNQPRGLAVDGAGNVYVADTANHTVRKITPAGVVTTVAGLAGSSGSTDATGNAARFAGPSGVAVDSAGNVFVADQLNNAVRRITPAGEVTTFAGTVGIAGSADGTGSAAQFSFPLAVALDTAGNVYVADNYYENGAIIRKITSAGVVTTLAGLAGAPGSADGTGRDARFISPFGVAVDSAGFVYVAERFCCTIRKITPGGSVSTLAGTSGLGSADGLGPAARFNFPAGVAMDSVTNLYVSDYLNHTIRKISPAGVVSTFAGLAGEPGGTDGIGSAARFFLPHGLAIDSADNLYVADEQNGCIRKVTPTGEVSTVASSLSYPIGVAVDNATNLYVSNTYGQTILKITPAGVVTTLAGAAATGSADGTGSAARFNYPNGIAVDGAGNVYVAEANNRIVRKITPAGVVTTLAGSAGLGGVTDGTGSAARFTSPAGVAVDGAGNVYVTEGGTQLVRKITPAGVVTTLGGSGVLFDTGAADGVGSAARFQSPDGIAVDRIGKLYVADSGNQTIRANYPALLLTRTTVDSSSSLTFAAWVGQQYRLDYKNSLSDPSWTMLTSGTLTGGSIQVTDSLSAGVANRFYRAVLLP